MTAAQTIKTPVMVLPPRRGSPDPLSDMHLLARRLRRISLGEVVAGESLLPRIGCYSAQPRMSSLSSCGMVRLGEVKGKAGYVVSCSRV